VLAIALDIFTTRKLGPAYFIYKGKHYNWRPYKDNCRAYIKPSIIWQLNNEYKKRGNSY
jgi:hypothetical protein